MTTTDPRPKKTVAACALKISYPIMRSDLSPRGRIFGGRMQYLLDDIAAQVAEAHCEDLVVTKFVDRLEFVQPADAKDTLIFRAAVNAVWNSSLEVGIRVCAKRRGEHKERHIVSAYYTFVCVDRHDQPKPIRYALEPETRAQKVRVKEACERRRRNLEDRAKKRSR